jgi:small-conductance mechanosensitive channel
MQLAGRLSDYEGVQKRVETLILVLATLGFAIAAWRWGGRAGMGFAAGATVAWINYRWLKRGVRAIFPGVPGAPEAKPEIRTAATGALLRAPKVPLSAFAKFFGRYLLLGVALYVILAYSLVPAAPFLAGLFVAAAAVLVEFSFVWMAKKA